MGVDGRGNLKGARFAAKMKFCGEGGKSRGGFVCGQSGHLPYEVMHLFKRYGMSVCVAALVACAVTPMTAQSTGNTGTSSTGGQSSSSGAAGATTTNGSDQSGVPHPLTAENGGYLAIDPLAGVRYDNRWDVSVLMGSAHVHAGPNLREGADLGGLDVSASYWLTKHWGMEGSARGYVGTTGVAPNDLHLDGLFIAESFGLVGPEYLGPHNKHADIIVHALVGGVWGDFNTDLRGAMPGPGGPAGMYANQLTLGAAVGGHIDLNRSPRWVFRVSPEALLSTYNGTSAYPRTQWNFGVSVGMEYKFKGTRFRKPRAMPKAVK